MEQCTLQNVNNCLNTNIFSYLDTPGGQSSNLSLNVEHVKNFFLRLLTFPIVTPFQNHNNVDFFIHFSPFSASFSHS